MEYKEEEVLKLAESLQDACHESVKTIVTRNTKISVQDATNVWLFMKLAEIELNLKSLLSKP